jgi:hypothetical protein
MPTLFTLSWNKRAIMFTSHINTDPPCFDDWQDLSSGNGSVFCDCDLCALYWTKRGPLRTKRAHALMTALAWHR